MNFLTIILCFFPTTSYQTAGKLDVQFTSGMFPRIVDVAFIILSLNTYAIFR